MLSTHLIQTVNMGGVLRLEGFGATLKLDVQEDTYYLEVDPMDFDRGFVRRLTLIAEACGYEVMPEAECPPQVMDDGAVRHWLAEKEVLHDRALKAV